MQVKRMLTRAAITGLVVTAIIQKLKSSSNKPKIPVWMVDDLLSTINAGIEDRVAFKIRLNKHDLLGNDAALPNYSLAEQRANRYKVY